MPTCNNCGAHVTVQFARVFGDNNDNVDRCLACTANAELDDTSDIEMDAPLQPY